MLNTEPIGLIDKKYDVGLTVDEAAELGRLQLAAREYRHAVVHDWPTDGLDEIEALVAELNFRS